MIWKSNDRESDIVVFVTGMCSEYINDDACIIVYPIHLDTSTWGIICVRSNYDLYIHTITLELYVKSGMCCLTYNVWKVMWIDISKEINSGRLSVSLPCNYCGTLQRQCMPLSE